MRLLFYILPFALAALVTGPVGASETQDQKAAGSGATAQEFSNSSRKYQGPRGGAR